MRNAFFRALLEMAQEDPRVSLVVNDLGFGVAEPFIERFPLRYVNAGLSEQNMTGLATGMSLCGKIVFTYSIGNFPTLRCLEQIRNDICYHHASVKVVAVGGGMAYGPLGFTHFAIEDLAVMRAMPDMVVVAPGDPIEAYWATRAITQLPGPCYIRLGRAGDPIVHDPDVSFQIGEAIVLREGGDLTLISTGGMLATSVDVANHLEERGLRVGVVSMHTLRPLDSELILRVAADVGKIVTIEEHSIIGGLGSAVAETLAEGSIGSTARLRRIGLPATLPTRIGSHEYLKRAHGLSVEGIVATIADWIEV